MNRNTILLVLVLLACISILKAESSTNNDSSKKTSAASANSIPTEKPEAFNTQPDQQFRYQQPQPTRYLYSTPQQILGQQQQLPEITRKQPYAHPPQPVAMVIIAQPAYIPAHMIQGNNVPSGYVSGNSPQANNIAQHLLHFFHTNPQARYQLLYGNQPQPQPTFIQPVFQPRYQTPVNPAIAAPFQGPLPVYQQHVPSEISSYQPHQPQNYVHHVVHPHPAQHLMNQHVAQSQLQRVQVPAQQLVAQQQTAPQQLNHIADIAQQAAQRFLSSGGFPQAPGVNGGLRTTPAVITGLENFSPEHQAKIKEQLSAHFGGALQPLAVEGAGAHKTAMAPSRSYFPNKYYREGQTEFVPSPQIKTGSAESEESQSVQYTKM